jgi:hypothetical protein
MIADLALFAYLAVGVSVAGMTLDLGYVRAGLIGALWPVSAALLLGETVGGWVRR